MPLHYSERIGGISILHLLSKSMCTMQGKRIAVIPKRAKPRFVVLMWHINAAICVTPNTFFHMRMFFAAKNAHPVFPPIDSRASS
ncbi:hypothetical protein CDAR_33841 [Caerostris darwini]|uniref:Uncharacterized protein n=1 Tax=Caerostris darwini TaxID=1538125 RepID=A0AAV4WE50_9ARAC|nr:hypothetical protein CDAR_33841 [Caerostris darwini]